MGVAQSEPLRRGVFAVAAPISGDKVKLTNLAWAFSTQSLRQELHLDHLDIINDFTAIAWAVPRLGADEHIQVGGGVAKLDAPIAIIGPGSGLGVAALIPVHGGWKVLPTEAGHVTLAAMTFEEDRVLAVLRRRFGHVSAERVLSGPGLVHLYDAILELDGHVAGNLSAKEVSARGAKAPHSHAGQAVEMFCQFLGTTASNAALNYDARGGVYLAGGIIGKLGVSFKASSFRARFESKGRFSDYLAQIPTFVVTHPFPAFAGLTKGSL